MPRKHDAARGAAPKPDVMSVDREEWLRQLHLSNFVNAYYQYRDVQRFGSGRRVLIVGPGQGLATVVLQWRGHAVVTLDIDETFTPDVVGSVHDMRMFGNREFDVVIASHVLEHLPLDYLDESLRELARVAAGALIYLPVAGRHAQLRVQPGVKAIDLAVTLDFFKYWERPGGRDARYCLRQHYWEIGRRGFRVRDVKSRLHEHFDILDAYRNRDWTPSYNFVLRSRSRT